MFIACCSFSEPGDEVDVLYYQLDYHPVPLVYKLTNIFLVFFIYLAGISSVSLNTTFIGLLPRYCIHSFLCYTYIIIKFDGESRCLCLQDQRWRYLRNLVMPRNTFLNAEISWFSVQPKKATTKEISSGDAASIQNAGILKTLYLVITKIATASWFSSSCFDIYIFFVYRLIIPCKKMIPHRDSSRCGIKKTLLPATINYEFTEVRLKPTSPKSVFLHPHKPR